MSKFLIRFFFIQKIKNIKFDAIGFSKLEAFPSSFIHDEDTVRKMPSSLNDTDSKYQSLLQICNEMYQNDQNVEPNSKIFENILEGLNWLTNEKDPLILKQLVQKRSAYLNPELNANIFDSYPHNNSSQEDKINVLVTGSLYLVGLTLKCLNFRID
jgi:hypothetical protein